MCNTMCNVDLDFIKAQPRLESSPLKTVICQVRYPTQLGFSDSRLRPVQRALAASYPRVEVAQLNEVRVDASGITPLATEDVFHLRDDSSTWTIAISRTFLSLETSSYADFPDFLRRWHVIVSVVADELDLERQERIGLRYVNEVPIARQPTASEL